MAVEVWWGDGVNWWWERNGGVMVKVDGGMEGMHIVFHGRVGSGGVMVK